MTLARLIEAVERAIDPGDAVLALPDQETTNLFYAANRGSIDAAKRLHDALLPGWFPGLSQNVHSGFWFAWVQTKDEKHFSATEADPARAFLLAILRAMEEEGR